MKVEALVFDMDGLLLDSERVVQRSWNYAGESSDTDGSGSIFIIRWDSMWSAEKHILKVYMAKIFRWISLMS